MSQHLVKDCASGLHFKPVVLIWFFLNLCAQVHTCMQRLKGSLRCYSEELHLFPLRWGLLLIWSSGIRLDWLSTSLGDLSVSAFQLRNYKHGPATFNIIFMWLWESIWSPWACKANALLSHLHSHSISFLRSLDECFLQNDF